MPRCLPRVPAHSSEVHAMCSARARAPALARKRLRLSIKQVESLESAANLKEFQSRQKKEKEEVQGANVMLDALKRAKLID